MASGEIGATAGGEVLAGARRLRLGGVGLSLLVMRGFVAIRVLLEPFVRAMFAVFAAAAAGRVFGARVLPTFLLGCLRLARKRDVGCDALFSRFNCLRTAVAFLRARFAMRFASL